MSASGNRLSPDAQFKADLREVLASPAGRRYAWALVERCGVFRDTWSASAEIHRSAGMRAVGLTILADIESVRPDLVRLPLQPAQPTDEQPREDDDSDA